MQRYLKDPKIAVKGAQTLFKFRTRTAKFKVNMRSSFKDLSCPYCTDDEDSQEHSFKCKVVTSNVNVQGAYDEIFNEKIPAEVSRTLVNIMKHREKVIEPSLGPRALHGAAGQFV